jgi:hypothetical protein
MIKDLTSVFRRTSLLALGSFLAVDAALLAWHLAHSIGGSQSATRWLATSVWSVERDRGVPEYWGYVLLVVTAAGLALLARRHHERVLWAWAAVWAVVFLDDWMMVHERGARVLLRLVGSPTEIAGVRAQDVGELVVWAGLAALPLLAVLLVHRTSGLEARRISWAMGLLITAMVFFGVVMDQVHSFFFDGIAPLGALEDGGELVTTSVAAALAIGLVRSWPARAAETPVRRSDVAVPHPSTQEDVGTRPTGR